MSYYRLATGEQFQTYDADDGLVLGIHVVNFPVSQLVRATALPLPNGAATEAALLAIWNRLGSVAVTGSFWPSVQPVSGTFWPATQPVSAASLPLPTGASTEASNVAVLAQLVLVKGVLDAILAKLPAKATTGTRTTPAVTIASTQVLAANPARVGAIILNPLGTTYVGLGAAAVSADSYAAKLGAGDSYTVPPGYAGPVTAVRGSGSGTLVVTELT